MKNQHPVDWKSILLQTFSGWLLLICAPGILAQDVPADLLNLSLEELFETDVEDTGSENQPLSSVSKSRWGFQLTYQRSRFDGYNDGSNELSLDEVLFSPGVEPRTAENFPVVPTTIYQDVQAFITSYDFNNTFALQIAVPYVQQNTDHISVIPGYDNFNIESNGFGDITLIGTYKFSSGPANNWLIGLGVSLPVGSIDEEGDTPRSPGNQLLPFSMQIGSGTYDLPMTLAYRRSGSIYSWGAALEAKLRLGENDHNYRLGNRVAIASWLRWNTLNWVKPTVKLSYAYTGKINGRDIELMLPMAFPYPAPVTNPAMYGGRQADLTIGFSIPTFGGRSIEAEISKPVYQSLNGPQTREDYRFGLTMRL